MKAIMILKTALFLHCGLVIAKRGGRDIQAVTNRADISLILRLHNEERAKVGLPAMEWDASLASFSAASVIPLSCSAGKMTHSGDKSTGENLGAYTADDVQAMVKASIKEWIDELQYYNYQSNTCSGGPCGHYTQVMWDVSTKVGCAYALNCPGAYGNYLSCNYKKKGNMCKWRPYGRSAEEECICKDKDGKDDNLCKDGGKISPYDTTPCVPGTESAANDVLEVSRTVSCNGACKVKFEYTVPSSGGYGNGHYSQPGSDTCPPDFLDWDYTFKKAEALARKYNSL